MNTAGSPGRSDHRAAAGREAARIAVYAGAHLGVWAYRPALACLPARVVAARGTEGPEAVVLAHSQGAFAAEAALRSGRARPRAVVLLDPSVEPDLAARAPAGGLGSPAAAAGRRGEGGPWEDAAAGGYRAQARAVASLRACHGLPDVPLVILSATWTRHLPRDRAWWAAQEWLVDTLARDHPRGAGGVAHHWLRGGHALMWWRPGAVAATLAAALG